MQRELDAVPPYAANHCLQKGAPPGREPVSSHKMDAPAARRVFNYFVTALLACPALLVAQEKPPATPPPPPPSIGAAWDTVIKDVVPAAPVSAALSQVQAPVLKGPAADIANHFFMELRSEYRYSDMRFTGLATPTGVINAPFNGVFSPGGFPWEQSFQPDANRMYGFLDFGTRGWLSDRVNTHFSLRYRQNLTRLNLESPNQNILGSYNGGRLIELVQGSIEINSKPTDGAWNGSTLELGRLNIYGAELATLDGASYRFDRRRVSLNLFGGRRYTYFSDPDQRGIGGGSLNFKLDDKTSMGYEALFYLRGTHRVNFRRVLTNALALTSYFRSYGGAPVDFNVQLLYGARSGRTSGRASFFQKLTNKDYAYDIYTTARDLDPQNRLLRLYLGQLQPYSLFAADGRQQIAPWLTLSGGVAIQHLNDSKNDQSAFQTSFQDYRGSLQLIPLKRVVTDFDYHRRNSDRLSPIPRTTFDNTMTSGETSVEDISGQIRRTFGEGGRLTLSGGLYYRRIGIQNRFMEIDGAHQSGWLAGATWKIDSHNRVMFDYALDNDFFVFRPSISNARVLRLAWTWKY